MKKSKDLIQKGLLFLLLFIFVFTLTGCLDYTGYDYLKIKNMLKDMFTLYHECDLEGYMEFWSLFSPYREEESHRAEEFFTAVPYFKDMVFGYYVDKFYYYEEGKAILKFTYIIGENINGKGTMILRKEGNKWKVWKIDW